MSSGPMLLGAKWVMHLAIPCLVLLMSRLPLYLPTSLEWARTVCMKLPTPVMVVPDGPTMKLTFLLSMPRLKLAGIMETLYSLLRKTLKLATL